MSDSISLWRMSLGIQHGILVFKALDDAFRHSWKIDLFTFSYSFITMLFPLPKKDAYRMDPHTMKRKCSLYTRHWLTRHLCVSRYSYYSSYLNGEWHFDIELLESYDPPSTCCIHVNINMYIHVARELHRLIQWPMTLWLSQTAYLSYPSWFPYWYLWKNTTMTAVVTVDRERCKHQSSCFLPPQPPSCHSSSSSSSSFSSYSHPPCSHTRRCSSFDYDHVDRGMQGHFDLDSRSVSSLSRRRSTM